MVSVTKPIKAFTTVVSVLIYFLLIIIFVSDLLLLILCNFIYTLIINNKGNDAKQYKIWNLNLSIFELFFCQKNTS